MGVLIWAGFIRNLLIELRTLSIVGPPIVTALFGIGLSLPVVYAGYRWQQEPWIDMSVGGRIVAWAISGLVFVTVTRGITLFIHITENHAVANPQLDILIGIGAGTIVGAALGFLYERVRYDTSQLREARNALVFLNRTLRHECLNGLNIIQGHTTKVATEVSDRELQKRLDAVQTRSTDMADVIQNLQALERCSMVEKNPNRATSQLY